MEGERREERRREGRREGRSKLMTVFDMTPYILSSRGMQAPDLHKLNTSPRLEMGMLALQHPLVAGSIKALNHKSPVFGHWVLVRTLGIGSPVMELKLLFFFWGSQVNWILESPLWTQAAYIFSVQVSRMQYHIILNCSLRSWTRVRISFDLRTEYGISPSARCHKKSVPQK